MWNVLPKQDACLYWEIIKASCLSVCETFWDHLRKKPAKNADEVSLTHLLHGIQNDRDQGTTTEFFFVLDKVVAAFKPSKEFRETLHAALMANHVPDEPIPPRRLGAKKNGG